MLEYSPSGVVSSMRVPKVMTCWFVPAVLVE